MIEPRRKFLSLAVGAAVVAPVALALPGRVLAASACVNCATEWTQIMNNVQLIAAYIRQGQQYAQQILQYVQQLRDSAELFRNGRAFLTHIFGPIQRELQQLASVVQQGRGLAYSMANLDEQFRNTFEGYRSPRNYGVDYQRWSSTTLDTIQGTLRAVGLHSSQLQSEQSIISALRSMATNADGRMQAANTANMIAAESVSQLQKLRALMLADLQSKEAYQAYVVQTDSAEKAAAEKFFRRSPVSSTPRLFKGGTL
jgi:P-type conjugative transfer protein TrbJ